MFKYLLAAVAAIYCGLLVFGDESRRPEVSRQASDDVTGLTLAAFTFVDTSVTVEPLISQMSDREAIDAALRAGETYRSERKRKALRGDYVASNNEIPLVVPTEDTSSLRAVWYVSGTRVNLRAGPGTGNAVVGQLVLGDAAEVLGDQDGWYQIRTADGAVSGWIFGKFLSETRPG